VREPLLQSRKRDEVDAFLAPFGAELAPVLADISDGVGDDMQLQAKLPETAHCVIDADLGHHPVDYDIAVPVQKIGE